MKTWMIHYGRHLALAIFILVSGCCYSCSGRKEAVFLDHADQVESWVQAEDTEKSRMDDEMAVKDAKVSEPQGEAEETAAACYVHVCGEVICPGVYEMKEGQRVYEAIELAGGFTGQAAESYLNLAEPVKDGMKLMIPDRNQLSGQELMAEDATSVKEHRINLNTASKEELMTLRGIGEARAEDIIRYREERGGFGRIEDIMEIPGIKDAAFQKIKDQIMV